MNPKTIDRHKALMLDELLKVIRKANVYTMTSIHLNRLGDIIEAAEKIEKNLASLPKEKI